MLFTTSLTVIGLASGAGSGKIARDLGNEALTRLSKELGVSLDVVLNSATKVAKDEYDISTLSDITRHYSEGKLKLSVFVGRVNVVVKSSDEYVQAVAAKYVGRIAENDVKHILVGEFKPELGKWVGGHRYGRKSEVEKVGGTFASSNHSEFPKSWSDEKILDSVLEVINNSNSAKRNEGKIIIYENTISEIKIRTVYDSISQRIITSYPI